MKRIIYILPVIFFLALGWIFLFTTYFLTCKSLERFDNAKTRMTFPYNCEASIDGDEYKVMNQ